MHNLFINMRMVYTPVRTKHRLKPSAHNWQGIGTLSSPVFCRWKTEPQFSVGERLSWVFQKGSKTVLFFRIVFPVDLTEHKTGFLVTAWTVLVLICVQSIWIWVISKALSITYSLSQKEKKKKKKKIFSKHRGHMCKYRGQGKTWHIWGSPNI